MSLRITLLGRFTVSVDGAEVPQRPGRARAVLARLALDNGRTVSRDALIRSLWGDEPPASAVNVVQIAVSTLRRELGVDAVRTDSTGYALGPAEVDLDDFLSGIRAGLRAAEQHDDLATTAALTPAIELFRPPLEDLGTQTFVVERRDWITERYLAAAEAHSAALIRLGRADAAVHLLPDLVDRNPLHEGLLEQLMLALAATGREAAALAAYESGRERIADELGVDPGTRLRDTHARILRGELPQVAPEPIDQRAEPEPPVSLRGANNLPIQSTSLVGRDTEIAELTELVMAERLVTLVGFGGMGKTRLALQVAAELSDGDADGVWFVDCTAVTDADGVAGAIAAALGVREGSDGAADTVVEWLRERRLLLVLDNLEQALPAAAPLVARILATAAGVHVIATSREGLRIAAEHVYPIVPLPVPVLTGSARYTEADVDGLSAVASVQLLIQRAAAARHGFRLTPTNAAAIAGVCARLDGVPLALELAAARLRMLSPESLLARLENTLGVLVGGNRDLPTRHQTLRASIAWSYDALDTAAQLTLDRLSAFPGSFGFDAAEVVAADDDIDVLDALGTLVDRSLVTVDGNDRYRLLVSIRDFAGERLAGRGEVGRTVLRHASHYAELLTLPSNWTREQEGQRDARVGDEWHNVRAAVEALHAAGQTEAEVELMLSAVRGLLQNGLLTDSERLLEHVAEHLGADPTRESVLAALCWEIVTYRRTRMTESRAVVMAAARDARVVGDPSLRAYTLSLSALFATTQAESDAALGEAERLLDDIRPGDALPRWRVEDCYAGGLVDTPFIDPVRAEVFWRARLPGLIGGARATGETSLAYVLALQGRNAEAADALAAFGAEEAPDYALAFHSTVATFNLAGLRLALHEWDEAARVFDVFARDGEKSVAVVDYPPLRTSAEAQRAASERGLGQMDRARDRLVELLDRSDLDESTRVQSGRLLAVVLREQGDAAGAAAALDRVWEIELDTVYSLSTALERMLERALQRLDTDPVESALLIGGAQPQLAKAVFMSGADYDLEAMLASLRGSLGEERTAALLAEGASRPLPHAAEP